MTVIFWIRWSPRSLRLKPDRPAYTAATTLPMLSKKAQLRDAQYKAYLNQQRDIKHQEAVIAKLKSFNREKSIKRAESREKMLETMYRGSKSLLSSSDRMRISLEPRVLSGNDVLHVEALSKAFPGQTLFSDISFDIKRGERVALIGNNGTGKTTMLKIINGLIEADAGKFSLGSKVQIGYYDQEHHVLHMDKTIFQEISDDLPDSHRDRDPKYACRISLYRR